MALVYMDGFDHRNPNRYIQTGGAISISNQTGGRSPYCLMTGYPAASATTMMFPVLPASTTYYVGLAVTSVVSQGFPKISLLNDAGTASLLDITFVAGGSMCRPILKKGSDGTSLVTPSVSFGSGSWMHVGYGVTIGDGSDSSGTFYVNGLEQGGFTGVDLRNGGTTGKSAGLKIDTPYNAFGNWYFDDVYVLDGSGSRNNAFLGDMSVKWLPPSGAGSSTQWAVSPSGSNWAAVDESGAPGADYVFSSTSTHTDLYATTDTTGTIYGVAGVQVHATALKSDSGAASMALLCRANSVTTEGADIALTTSSANYYLVRDEASSGVAWTKALVDAMEIGAKVK